MPLIFSSLTEVFKTFETFLSGKQLFLA